MIRLEHVDFPVECGENGGVNQGGATASNSSNGWRTTAECWSKVVGLLADSWKGAITTHRSRISSAASFELFARKPLDSTGPNVSSRYPCRSCFAASLLFEDRCPHHNFERDLPPLGHVFPHTCPRVPLSHLPPQ